MTLRCDLFVHGFLLLLEVVLNNGLATAFKLICGAVSHSNNSSILWSAEGPVGRQLPFGMGSALSTLII